MPWKEWSVMDERLKFVARRVADKLPFQVENYIPNVKRDLDRANSRLGRTPK